MSVMLVNCPKCAGKGIIEKYAHINRGICYKCDGTGKVEMQVRDDMDETVLKAFPNLYIEHKYSEPKGLSKEDLYYYETVRKKHNETVAKFLAGNEEFKESIAYIEEWGKRNDYENYKDIYSISYGDATSEGANGSISSYAESVVDIENKQLIPLRFGVSYSIQPDSGFPNPGSNRSQNKKDAGYDEDNTFLHEAIHYVDMVNQNARMLGKPDSDKRKRLAQAKMDVLDDYIKATTGDSIQIYDRNIADTPLARFYLDNLKVDETLKYLRKNGQFFKERGMTKPVSDYVKTKLGKNPDFTYAVYADKATELAGKGEIEEAILVLKKLQGHTEGKIEHQLENSYEGVIPSNEGGVKKYVKHLDHLPLQLALKSAIRDEDVMSGKRGTSDQLEYTKDMEELITHARDTFQETRTSENTHNTLNEIMDYAGNDLEYEEMDFLRKQYRILRGMDKPDEGETYLSTIEKLRNQLVGNPHKYGMSPPIIDNILTRMTFDHYLPSFRTDAYSLYNANEFNAELGSSMLGSTVDEERFTEPMKELKKAFEQYYGWDGEKSLGEQKEKTPLIENVRDYLLDKRNEQERMSNEYYRAWEALRESYTLEGDYGMSGDGDDFMDDLERLESDTVRETGQTLRQVLGEEPYKNIRQTYNLYFPKEALSRMFESVNLEKDTDINEYMEDIYTLLDWKDMNEKVVESFVQESYSDIRSVYKYYSGGKRAEIREMVMEITGKDLDVTYSDDEEEEDDF